MLYASPPFALWRREGHHWPDFSLWEFICHCQGRYCQGEYYHNPVFLDCLQALRNEIARPLMLNSAHRCDLWNAHIGGAPLSQHKKLAVDIRLAGHDREKLLKTAKKTGFTGFGFYQTFLHLDQGRPRFWYGSKQAQKAWTKSLHRQKERKDS